jgi:hypothetical protein
MHCILRNLYKVLRRQAQSNRARYGHLRQGPAEHPSAPRRCSLQFTQPGVDSGIGTGRTRKSTRDAGSEREQIGTKGNSGESETHRKNDSPECHARIQILLTSIPTAARDCAPVTRAEWSPKVRTPVFMTSSICTAKIAEGSKQRFRTTTGQGLSSGQIRAASQVPHNRCIRT